jgi:hypothetical protein
LIYFESGLGIPGPLFFVVKGRRANILGCTSSKRSSKEVIQYLLQELSRRSFDYLFVLTFRTCSWTLNEVGYLPSEGALSPPHFIGDNMYRNCTNCGREFRLVITVGNIQHCSMKCAEEELKRKHEESSRKVQPQVQQGKGLR